MRLRLIVGVQVAILSLLVVLALWHRDTLSERFEPIQVFFPASGESALPPADVSLPAAPSHQVSVETPEKEVAPIEDGGLEGGRVEGVEVVTSKILENVDDYVRAIFDPADATFERLECPVPLPAVLARYETLRSPAATPRNAPRNTPRKIFKYYFALDLTQAVDLLPRLIGSIVEAIRFLGPENCVLSVVEGNSDDGTTLVFDAIRPELDALGIGRYFFETSSVNPKEGENQRVVSLAKLRNLALQPMLDNTRHYSEDTTVIFLNDVAICMEDILELAYQRNHLGADMTCAMDWTYVGPHPTFYDVWVSRTMTGESFFRIPEDRSWDEAWNLFWNDHETKSRYSTHLPFQVFSCWNGAVAFSADPILYGDVAFRSSNPGECFQGEPELFCKDLWYKGWGKIAMVPSVNLEYSDDQGRAIKAQKGYTSKWTGPEQDKKSKIEWQQDPPEQVKCMEVMEKPEWRPWDETLITSWSRKARRSNRKHRRRGDRNGQRTENATQL
ncbi:alpha-mannosyltransferase cmt1 [Diaporthe eres]|nr:alpha-mannosyltransferase cmt1 [Diaporthe eres]